MSTFHPLVSLSFLGLLLTTSLPGQVVSPLGFDTVEGDSNNAFPFNSSVVRRYMQIHADLGTTPLVITGMSFRVNASTTNYTGTRAQDIEVYMGDGLPNSVLLPSLTYDANYAAPKTTVLPRTIVTHGPTGQAVTPGPNPFTMDVVFTTPYVYTGTAPLVWEVALFGSVLTGTFSQLDADGSPVTSATSTITGTGCAPTGSATLMTHTYSVVDVGGILWLNGTITGGPPNQLALMAIGFSNPSAPLPGLLCSNLYTDAAVLQVLGFTSATGAYTADNPTGAIIIPNTAAGVTLFTQAFVFDPLSLLGLPLTASNGRSATVPSTSPVPINLVTRLWNNVGGTTATTAVFASTSRVGYGLVTRFNHL